MPLERKTPFINVNLQNPSEWQRWLRNQFDEGENLIRFSNAVNRMQIAEYTLTVNGASQTVNPNTGFLIVPQHIKYDISSIVAETLTVTVQATYNDGTTVNLNKNFTGNGVSYAATADLVSLFKDKLYIIKLILSVTSTLNPSSAVAKLTPIGVEA